MPHSDNTRLIEAARQGDREAIERLLVVCRFDLRRMAQSECATTADAEDAVQETMLQVYRRIGALRTLASFSAWTFAIVRRECHRLMRRMRGHAELPDDDHPMFARWMQTELNVDLAAAIESLPPKYREAILLRDCEERSISEMAQALQLSREAVKSRIHRGRLLIREYLED
ncbi:MAG: RNA polymerase sigma factor [Frateuria sp.]|uniref:RNA polymerase sigma factor n=1 Tax=Frateuria sp. TaxID=2211372 RepID=UPI001841F35F|nr:RNA polymerase sigma factor [Frateuria sp.]NUO72339.1 RNA polymerase sigma factor [Frateuria sp.]NUR23301.1 RNA polymerase sigma factor [Frateuria sp.]